MTLGTDSEAPKSGKYEHVIGKSVKSLADRYDPSAVDPPLEARVRLVSGDEAHDALVDAAGVRIVAAGGEPDAVITGPPSAWQRAANGHGGLASLGDGIRMRHNLHVATGFLAATAGDAGAGRLRLETVDTKHGPIATAQAGTGPALLAVHGLGGTKASFLPTLALMSRTHRVIAIDLPGFGDSVKPLRAPFDARYFAGVLSDVLDALEIERAHVAGNSMGGRIALELALTEPSRVDRLVLLAPAMAWLRPRRWAPVVRMLRPELTMLPMPVERSSAASSAATTTGPRRASTSSCAPSPRRAAATPSTPCCATSTSTRRTATTGCGRGWPRCSTTPCSSGAGRTGSSRSPS